jgi:hypothetical protein
MNSYLVSHLSESQVKVLQDGGITFYVFDQSTQSYIIEGADYPRALQLLNAVASESPSQYTGVIEAKLTVQAPPVEALIDVEGTGVLISTNGNQPPDQRFIAMIEEVLGNRLDRRIMLHLPPRGERARRTRIQLHDEHFHIHLWSSPSGQRRRTPPQNIYGLAVDCREKSYGPLNQGIPLFDKESEYAIGEIFEQNLYIHHDAINSGSDNEYALLRAILLAAAPDLTLSTSERAQRIKDRHKEGRTRSRQLYVKACGKRIQELVEATRASLAKRLNQLSEIQKQALSLIRLDNFGGKALDAVESRRQFKADFEAEFEAIKAIDRVKSVSASQNLVMVKTDLLCAQNPQTGQTHEIGEFLIVIDLRGGRKTVRWFNSSRRINGVRAGMNAPTVYADGTPVINEIQETMIELVARLQLSIVVELAIQFVETINNDLPGARVVDWPVAA